MVTVTVLLAIKLFPILQYNTMQHLLVTGAIKKQEAEPTHETEAPGKRKEATRPEKEVHQKDRF